MLSVQSRWLRTVLGARVMRASVLTNVTPWTEDRCPFAPTPFIPLALPLLVGLGYCSHMVSWSVPAGPKTPEAQRLQGACP